MAVHVSLSYPSNDVPSLCNKLDCRENEIGRVMKASTLGYTHSPFYRQNLDPSLKHVEEMKKPTDLEQLAQKSTMREIDTRLGIRGGNFKKKLLAKGMYFSQNVDKYLMKYVNNCRRYGFTKESVRECRAYLFELETDEYFMLEKLRRVKNI